MNMDVNSVIQGVPESFPGAENTEELFTLVKELLLNQTQI